MSSKKQLASYQVTGRGISLDSQESVSARGVQKHCILLHGWNSSGNDMLRLKAVIEALPRAAGYRFWWPTYDTNAPFINNAMSLNDLFNQQGYDFSNSLVVAYSMGGVVARSMFVQGFRFRNLVTICSPHEGLAGWIPTPTSGTMSIAPWSDDLKKLNRNSIDHSKHGDYYFFGITYNDLRGFHDDDAVVETHSARALNVNSNIKSGSINLDYGGGLAGVDPHSRGMDPSFLQPVLNVINRLL